jgi:hypothetical protein
MQNPVFVILGVVACLVASTVVVAAQRQGRSYEECRQLAISRGDVRTSIKAAARYQRRKAAGLTTHPTGIIARCMAGSQD